MKTGKIPERVLTRSVLKQLHTKRTEIINGAGIGVDCAILAPGQEGLLAAHVGQGILSLDMFCPREKPAESGTESSPWEKPAESGTESSSREKSAESGTESSPGRKPSADLGIPHGTGVEEAFWYRLITGCANNLAASGAQPLAVEISLTLPEQLEETQLKRLVAAAESVCSLYGMQIAGGHTLVSNMTKAVIASVTAYGMVSSDTIVSGVSGCGGKLSNRGVGPDQDVVISKWIGLEGTALAAGKCKESLLKRYPAWLVEEAVGFGRYLSVLPEAAVALKSGVRAMHDASWGGIFAALWELSQRTGVGLSIDLRKLPVRQETIEVCELLGLNPYVLMAGGSLVMIADDGEALVRTLKEQGIPAAVAGRTTQSKERIITNEGEVRYLERPGEDEIRKIYPGDGDMVFMK